MALVIKHDLEPGEQLFIRYVTMSATSALQTYGWLPADAPHQLDEVVVALPATSTNAAVVHEALVHVAAGRAPGRHRRGVGSESAAQVLVPSMLAGYPGGRTGAMSQLSEGADGSFVYRGYHTVDSPVDDLQLQIARILHLQHNATTADIHAAVQGTPLPSAVAEQEARQLLAPLRGESNATAARVLRAVDEIEARRTAACSPPSRDCNVTRAQAQQQAAALRGLRHIAELRVRIAQAALDVLAQGGREV